MDNKNKYSYDVNIVLSDVNNTTLTVTQCPCIDENNDNAKEHILFDIHSNMMIYKYCQETLKNIDIGKFRNKLDHKNFINNIKRNLLPTVKRLMSVILRVSYDEVNALDYGDDAVSALISIMHDIMTYVTICNIKDYDMIDGGVTKEEIEESNKRFQETFNEEMKNFNASIPSSQNNK